VFCGNSHTAFHNVPNMVRKLTPKVESRRVEIQHFSAALLNECWTNEAIRKRILAQKHDAAVLQGAAMSSSHKYAYRQDGGIELAKELKRGGAKVLFFAEWPRKGWDETGYILGVYQKLATAVPDSEIIPVPKVWDAVRKRHPNLDYWSQDGNHAALDGAYLAACVISSRLAGPGAQLAKWTPEGITAQRAALIRNEVRAALKALK
jgi:hypothetical protein